MRAIIFGIILLLAFLPINAFCQSDILPRTKIGVSTALTGDVSAWGLDIRDILLFASQKLAPNKYEFIFEDDRCKAKDAVSIAHKLATVDKASYVIGFPCSGTVLSSAPIYKRAKTLVMVFGGSSPRIADLGDNLFRTFPSDEFAAKKLVEYLNIKGIKKLAVLSAEDEYSQDLKGSFVKQASALGIKVITEDYLVENTDFRLQLLRMRKTNPEGLFINCSNEPEGARLIKQFREMKWDVPVYAAYFPASPSLLEVAAKDLEAVEFVDTQAMNEILTREGKKLLDEYTAQFGVIRSGEALFFSVFEGFRALDQAISSGQDVIDYLYKTKFHGITGDWTFDKSGEFSGINFVMKRIKNGKVEMLSTSGK